MLATGSLWEGGPAVDEEFVVPDESGTDTATPGAVPEGDGMEAEHLTFRGGALGLTATAARKHEDDDPDSDLDDFEDDELDEDEEFDEELDDEDEEDFEEDFDEFEDDEP